MNKNFLSDEIIKVFGYEPTASQILAIKTISAFFCDENNYCSFLLTGYAGTGKTTLISTLVNVLNGLKINTVLLAPTGRAAKVLSSYSSKKATTIHKCIYRKKNANNINDSFNLNFNKYKDTIFIIDESSMIENSGTTNSVFGSGKLLDDIFNFVFSGTNCRIMFVGDPAQLPPIGTNLSPALNEKYLNNLDLVVYSSELTDVVRQSYNSGILFNATTIRKIITKSTNYKFPKFRLKNFDDIKYINGTDVVEEIDCCYSKYGIEETKVICKTNKGTNIYNNGIRNRILWRDEEICSGDLLLVVKNNYTCLPEEAEMDFVANGDIVEVIKVLRKQEIYEHRYADLLVRFVDFPELEITIKVILDLLTLNTATMGNDYYKNLYEKIYPDYEELQNKSKINEAIFNDVFFNALQVKFAYSLTCHKSQGGQWKCVFIDHEWLNIENFSNETKYEFLRWLYTAVTRASEKLYLVNFNPIFFEKE